MERRKALKIIGCVLGCVGGQAITESVSADEWWKSKPTKYVFQESRISEIVFIRSNGKEISVKFSDVLDALQDVDKEG